jgi:hypothetical protein
MAPRSTIIRGTTINLIDDLLTALPDGPVKDVRVDAFWTAVVVEVDGVRRCGLASTLRDENHNHNSKLTGLSIR